MSAYQNILTKIIAHKKMQLALRKSTTSLSCLRQNIEQGPLPSRRPFKEALVKEIIANNLAIIAELKQASPSKGILCQNYQPREIAKSYEKNGATCLSVLTETDFFLGSDEDLTIAKSATQLPILRKDFVVDPYQLYEARELGADCILLIVAALSSQQVQDFFELATDLNLDVIIEINNEEELAIALNTKASIIGINNRNLKDFSVDLNRTISLAKLVPENRLVVCESGIQGREDIDQMLANNIRLFLIGEMLMKSNSPGFQLAELLGKIGRNPVGKQSLC